MYFFFHVGKQMADIKVLLLYSNAWNRLTLCKKKRAQARLKMLSKICFTNHIYLIYMYKEDLALNNQQW